ncbi:60 kDa jasmonate-induced protein [Triticum urartu]|uniref:rRNA N-glycosylase n=2 Tax=Triticum urartu TaxID=4572 RepID=M8AU74_TRIUA|nr:60 kDa jasmonate-induced protein-like [Triticum urartu]EMS68795.1 60 kDa jasmonate-induced protein [Triticum urartu]
MAQEVVTFNVLSDSYATFISTLRSKLPSPNADTVGEKKGKQRPVLAKQTGADKPPPRWIHVELKGKGGAAPKVAIRSDNVYIFAFTNAGGKWFKLTKGKTSVLPDATPLGFDGHYTTLVGGATNLSTLKLGKYTTSEAAGTLWNHNNKSYVNADLKKAVATLCVVLSEAARLTPVYDAVITGWDEPAGVSIAGTIVKNFITNWGDLSKALLGWKRDAYKNDAKWFKNLASAGISTGEEALAVVELLLNNPPALSLLSWLKHLWGLLVNGQEDPAKSSAIVTPL